MDNNTNYLMMLSESLDKKLVILKELKTYTDMQKNIIESETFNEEDFNNNIEKKSGLISELQRLDNGFQLLYDNISIQLKDNREKYKNEIFTLQQKIKEVMDLNASIQVLEAHNKDITEKKFAKMKREVHQVKKSRDMAANYYRNMNNISSEPYFLDKKK